ncbi:MAG: hypothetical protein Q8S33_12030 [Myxococcales bacterium]|nr:hypothetical protein [Myxococcales bacterium]
MTAGTLTFTGHADGGLILNPMATNVYFGLIVGRFNAGAVLSVQASGGTVPAFTAQVTAPEAIALTTPACSMSNCGTASKAMGLSLSWTGASTGVVRALLFADNDRVYLNCSFPANAGTGQIAPTTLARLPEGQALLTVGATNTTNIVAGSIPVSFTAADETTRAILTLTP